MPSIPGPPGATAPGSLWDEIVARLGKDPRPLDSEGSARTLQKDWSDAKDTITADSKEVYNLAGQVPETQKDGVGLILQNSMIQMVEQLDQTANQMAGRAASAGRYAGVLNSIRISIHDNVNRNINAYNAAIAKGISGYAIARQIAATAADSIGRTLEWAQKTLEAEEEADPTNSTIPQGGKHSAADILNRAKDGQATPDEINSALALLKQVNDSTADGKLDKTEMNFLDQTIGALDKDYLQLPDKIGNVPGANETLGNSLLTLSNEKLGGGLLSSGAGTENAPKFGLPPGIAALVTANPVQQNYTTDPKHGGDQFAGQQVKLFTLENEAGWRGLSTLLGSSTVAGGTDFSQNLTNRVADITTAAKEAAKIDTTDPRHAAGLLGDHDKLSGDLQNILDASTRNNEANHLILTDQDNADHTGNAGLDSTATLRTLSSFEWADDGDKASGLLNWIGKDGHSADPAVNLRASEASANVLRAFGNNDAYNEIFDGVRANPNLANGYGNVVTGNIDAFADNQVAATKVDGTGDLNVAPTDAARILATVATNPQVYNTGVAPVAGAHGAQILDDVRAGLITPQDGARMNANLDGQIAAAPGNAYEKQFHQPPPADIAKPTNLGVATGRNLVHLGADILLKDEVRAVVKFVGSEAADVQRITGWNPLAGTESTPSPVAEPPANMNSYLGGPTFQGSYDYLDSVVSSGQAVHDPDLQRYLVTAPDGRVTLRPIGELWTDSDNQTGDSEHGIVGIQELAQRYGGGDYVDKYEDQEPVARDASDRADTN